MVNDLASGSARARRTEHCNFPNPRDMSQPVSVKFPTVNETLQIAFFEGPGTLNPRKESCGSGHLDEDAIEQCQDRDYEGNQTDDNVLRRIEVNDVHIGKRLSRNAGL